MMCFSRLFEESLEDPCEHLHVDLEQRLHILPCVLPELIQPGHPCTIHKNPHVVFVDCLQNWEVGFFEVAVDECCGGDGFLKG